MLDASQCPLCGAANDCQRCAISTDKVPCWCVKLKIPEELISQLPLDLHNNACICRECVMAFHRKKNSGTSVQKIPFDDFHFENDLIVFTKDFHLRRGYCCAIGYRHCPYGMNQK